MKKTPVRHCCGKQIGWYLGEIFEGGMKLSSTFVYMDGSHPKQDSLIDFFGCDCGMKGMYYRDVEGQIEE